MEKRSEFGWRRLAWSAAKLLVAGALVAGVLPFSCDQNAQAVFRQAVTVPIGDGVKTALAGDPQAGVASIVGAVIDGAVASIVQAGKGP